MALEQCQDINAVDIYGYTALYWAALMGHREVALELLKDNKIDVNKPNSFGKTPLHVTSMNGSLEQRWEEMNMSLSFTNVSLNMESMNSVQIVKALLMNDKIKVNMPDLLGGKPLRVAPQAVYYKVIQEVLNEPETYVYEPDLSGKTPLIVGLCLNNTDMVNLSLRCDEIDIFLALLPNRTGLNRSDSFRKTGQLPMNVNGSLEELKDVSMIISFRNLSIYAASRNSLQIVRALLMDNRTDVNKQDSLGWTPLHMATKAGYLEVVRELLNDSGIDVNKANLSGKTPLIVASCMGNTEVVKLLLQSENIDINSKDDFDMTALDCAKENGHPETTSAIRAVLG